MTTKEELLQEIEQGRNLIDLGYDFADLDRRAYCLWVLDCARHVLPLAERHLSEEQTGELTDLLQTAEQYLDGKADQETLQEAIAAPDRILQEYLESHDSMRLHLLETLNAIRNAAELTIPGSKVYHEDVIAAASRAAWDGELHRQDHAEELEASDCFSADELVGSEESKKEIEWQTQALKMRLMSSS